MLRTEALERVSLALQLGDGLPLGNGLGHGFAIHFLELWLEIKGFEMGGASRHAEEDNSLGFGREACARGELGGPGGNCSMSGMAC